MPQKVADELLQQAMLIYGMTVEITSQMECRKKEQKQPNVLSHNPDPTNNSAD